MSDESAILPEAAKNVKLPKQVEKMLAEVGRSTNTDMVFGETRVVGDHALIPVGRVSYGGGGGGGVSEPSETQPAGGGNGMGIMVNARPLGVIKITGGKVEWMPIMDVGALATVGAIVAGALAILFMIGRNQKLTAKTTHASPGGAQGLFGVASEAVKLMGKVRSRVKAA